MNEMNERHKWFHPNEAVEMWLREEVAATFDAWVYCPDQVVTAAEIRTRMKLNK